MTQFQCLPIILGQDPFRVLFQLMIDQIHEIKSRAIKELEATSSPEDLEKWRIAYLGRKGALTQVLRGIGSLAQEERKSMGAAANEVKTNLENALAEREDAFKQLTLSRKLGEAIDVTLPGHRTEVGRLHPTTQMLREICGPLPLWDSK